MDIYATRRSTKTYLDKFFCRLCDTNMNVKSKTGHINGNVLRRRAQLVFTGEKYDFDNPEINQIGILLKDVIKLCKDKYFKYFEYGYEHDIKNERNAPGEVFCFKIN